LQGFTRFSQGKREIRLKENTVDDVKAVHEALRRGSDDKKLEKSIENFSLKDLVERVNLFDIFGVPNDVKKIFLKKIKIIVDNGDGDIDDLKELQDHLQKSLILVPTIDCLKSLIMKTKNMKYDRYLLKGDIELFGGYVYALSPDSKHIVFCNTKNIILFNIENPDKSTHKSFDHQMGRITAVAFSPDGKNIVFGGAIDHAYFSFMLWNIENLDNNVLPSPVINEHFISSLVFSPNGKYIFSGGTSLAVWDASNLENIALKSPHPADSIDIIHSLAISPDGTFIVSGGKRLLLWDVKDVKDVKKITYKVLGSGEDNIVSLGFSPDGKYIILSNDKRLILWGVDDSKNNVLRTCQEGESIGSLGFSSDGKTIAYHNSGDSIADFILYKISNLENITPKILMNTEPVVIAVCSPDGDKIVSVISTGWESRKLYLSIIFTDEEMSVVNKLKEYNVDQLRLVYELCLWSLKGQAISPSREDEVKKTFETLPKNMKKLLYKLRLFNKRQSFPKLIFKKELE